jgi:hypothetical protein
MEGLFPTTEPQRLSPSTNGKKQQRRPDRPRVPLLEEEDPRVSRGLGVSATRGLHKSHRRGLVTGDCLFKQFLLLMSDFPGWKILKGRQNHKQSLRGKFPCYGGSYLRRILTYCLTLEHYHIFRLKTSFLYPS